MLRSRANTLISVRRVTERNAGRLTAGVDGEVVLTPEAKARLVDRIQYRSEPFKAMPVRRVYIPKRGSSTKRRPLGIPVILDRCHQARVAGVLEPEWEARFEPRSLDSGPDAAAMTRSKRSSTPPRARTRSGGGRLTQTSQGRSTASPTTTFWPCSARSRKGDDRAMVESGRGRAGQAAPHRGGNPSRRCNQPCALERRPARDGAGRRSPLLPLRHACQAGRGGLPGPGQIRRRSCAENAEGGTE